MILKFLVAYLVYFAFVFLGSTIYTFLWFRNQEKHGNISEDSQEKKEENA